MFGVSSFQHRPKAAALRGRKLEKTVGVGNGQADSTFSVGNLQVQLILDRVETLIADVGHGLAADVLALCLLQDLPKDAVGDPTQVHRRSDELSALSLGVSRHGKRSGKSSGAEDHDRIEKLS